jgi:hypothetical protein
MNPKPLGFLLQEALDAAFSGKFFAGPEEIAQWGREIVGRLQESFMARTQLFAQFIPHSDHQ